MKEVYEATHETAFRRDRGLREQIQNASVSLMANVAEGFDRQSKREFTKFLYCTLGSASEVQSYLYVALDQHYISEQEFLGMYDQVKATKKIGNGFISYLKRKKGPEHRNAAALFKRTLIGKIDSGTAALQHSIT